MSRLRRLEALADRFIPPAILNRSPEDARRARFAVALCWFAGCSFILAAFVQGPVNNRALLVLNALSALLCFSAPFVFRRVGRLALICHVVFAIGFCKYVSVPILLRGAGLSGATVLLSQLPLFATLVLGVRAGAAWAILCTTAGVAIGLLGRAGIIVDHLPAANRLFNDHFVLALSTVVLFSVAALYERRKDSAQRHIYDLEARRQAAEIERLEAVSKAQLAEAERFASLGRIAAATAHEINNPLTSVVANLELVQESLPADLTEIASALRDAALGAERIGRIVANMRLCSQPLDGALSAVRLEDAVELALEMARPRTRACAQVHTRLAEALPPVVADVSRLAEVLMNLLVNAAQAIPEGEAAANEIVIEAHAAEGRVVVEVRDTGRGIPPELIDKVREPFFTTRSVGQGTGLGLALCEGIVQSFGGTMTLESRPGRTVARITLAAAAAQPTELSSRAVEKPVDRKSALRILIIDDEEAVARTLRRILAAHSVTIAGGGRQALELLGSEPPFDLIFCDLMMPELTGMDLFERLHAANRELAERIVFMTGGTFTERARKFSESVRNTFLEKPFDLAIIHGIVSAVGERER